MVNWMLEKARAMGLTMTREQAEKFAAYHDMLVHANRQFNLTRVPDDFREAADRNYLDCLTPLLHGWPQNTQTLADVGSGAGFPGVPLSILLPDVRVTLLDSLDKRVKFLQNVINALGLNAEAVHLRAEDAGRRPEYREQFDVTTARAVASMTLLAEYLLPLTRIGGTMMALKGPGAEEELAQAAHALSELGGRADSIEPAPIPGRDWDHRIIRVIKTAPTPDRYPRKPGVPEKRPLFVTKP